MKKSFFSRIMDFFRELFTPRTPSVPTTPTTPTVPSEPSVPETPVTPTEPETPTTPEVPEEPTTPETPTEPETPVEPEVPVEPETPTEPEVPETPVGPEPPVVVEPEPPVVVEPPVDNRNPSAFSVNTIGDVYVGDKVTLLFSLKGTVGSATYPIDYADVDVEFITADGISFKSVNTKTQPYGSANEGTISYTFTASMVGEDTLKLVFKGDNLYKGCEITKVVKVIEKPVVVTPPPLGGDVTKPDVPTSVIERMGVNTVTGKLTIGGKDVTDLIQGVNDSTLLAYAIMGFLNGETSVRGKNQVFPKFQGTITCSSAQDLFAKYFAYMKKYGLKILRVGGHDIWGTGLQYEAWKNKHDAFMSLLKTMADEAAKAGIYLILVLGGTQDYPAYTYGGSGDVFDPASTAFAGYKAYVKDVMGTLEPYNAIGLFDMFNEPDHDRMGSKYWTSHGGKTAFNLWANAIASATNGFSTHPRCMGVAGLGAFFAWGQADFNLATGDVALETLDRHFYASAQDAYLFTDPQAWAKAKNKPLIWTEVGYNGIYPEGYWPVAVTALKGSGGQVICWMSLNAYPNYPNLTIETSSTPSSPTTPDTSTPSSPTTDATLKYKVISNDTNYNVLDVSGNIKYYNTNPTTAINWAITNLTAGRTSYEKVLLVGTFPLSAPILPINYTEVELQGKAYWSKDSVGLLVHTVGKNNIIFTGGEWDANQKIRARGGMDSGAFLFENGSDIKLRNGTNNRLYVHDTSYGNVRTESCKRVHIDGIECGYVGDYGKTTDQVREAWRGPGMNLFNTNDSIVENCYIHDTASGGCYFYTEDDGTAQTINNNIIRGNKVERCLTSGLSLSTRGVEDKVDNGLIENNEVVDCGEDGDHPGINIGWGAGRLATNTIVRNNHVYATRGLCEAAIEFAGDGCICENNNCHDVGGPAVHVVGKSNKITGNTVDNCGKIQGYPGMLVEQSNSNTITGNTIKNCNTGLQIYQSNDNVATNNTFSGNKTNITVTGTNNVTAPNSFLN